MARVIDQSIDQITQISNYKICCWQQQKQCERFLVKSTILLGKKKN